MLRTAMLCFVLAAATGWVYADTLRFDFVTYDDPGYVVANPSVALGISWAGLRYALTSGDMLNWQPLTWLSYMLDYELHGLDASGYHATNLVLHVFNTLLLFLVLRSMTRAEWSSALVAALFGLHPLHVQSVAWISERKDVLSTFFGLLATGAYVAYTRQPSRARFLLVAVFFALGLMAKTMLVTLPLLFLLLDYWPLARWRRGLTNAGRLVAEKVPLLLLALAAGVATFRAQRAGGALNQLSGGDEGAGFSAVNLANAAVAYVRYLMLTLWPHDLSIFYPHPARPEIGGTPLAAWQVAGAGALLAVITLAVIRSRRPYAVVGWLWFLVGLLPVIGIVQSGSQALADRYTYVPLIGVFIAAVWGGAELAGRWRPRGRSLAPAAGAAVVIALVLCAVAAQRATQPWRDSVSLYEHALAINPRSNLIRLNLGNVLVRRGDVAGALEHFRIALEVNPDYVDAHNNLGLLLLGSRRYAEAISHFEAVLRLQPDHAVAHNALGNAWRAQGRDDLAIHHYRRAIELGLERPETHLELANLLRRRGDLTGAMRHYRRVLAIDPADAHAARAVESLAERGIPTEGR